MQKLSHSNIVKAFDFFINELSGKTYLVMEYIQGNDILVREGAYTEEAAKHIFKQVLEGIKHMHE